jgi:hypothetical protein
MFWQAWVVVGLMCNFSLLAWDYSLVVTKSPIQNQTKDI